MIISTFHSLCVRILSVDIDRLGYNGKFSIYNSADQKQLYVEVYRGAQN